MSANPDPEELEPRVVSLLAQLDRCAALDDAAASAFDELLELIPRLAGEVAERLCGPEARLAGLYGDYVRRREGDEARALLADPDPLGVLRRGAGGLFAGRSFRRVWDLFARVDFSGCREFVMVGCGPLPVTLLHVGDRTGTPSIVGLELDADAAALAASVCGRSGRVGIRVEVADGRDYDFGAADVVYVANLVRPKADVVARVAETVRPGTRVVVREPFAAGSLLAERGLDRPHPGFELLACGPGDPRFLSHEVFLEASA